MWSAGIIVGLIFLLFALDTVLGIKRQRELAAWYDSPINLEARSIRQIALKLTEYLNTLDEGQSSSVKKMTIEDFVRTGALTESDRAFLSTNNIHFHGIDPTCEDAGTTPMFEVSIFTTTHYWQIVLFQDCHSTTIDLRSSASISQSVH